MSDIIDFFNRAIAPIRRRVLLSIGRAVVKLVNDEAKMQLMQIGLLAGEVKDNVERFQNYGFTSVPHSGAEAAVIFPGGNREHGIVIAVDDRRYRLKCLKQGEVALYDDLGKMLVFKRDGILLIEKIKKLQIKNDANEYVTVNSDLIQAIINARTQTLMGPQPLLNIPDPFPKVKSRLDTFKKEAA